MNPEPTRISRETLVVHGSSRSDQRTGALVPPLVLSATFAHGNQEQLAYSRDRNPTWELLEAAVAQHDETYHLTRLDFSGGSLWVGQVQQPFGSKVRARVLARDVSIATQQPHGSSITNILHARIAEIRDEGPDKVIVRLAVGASHVLLSRITRRSRDLLKLSVGMDVFAQVKSVALMA